MLSEETAIKKLIKIREDTAKANECGLSNNDFKEEIEVYDTVLNLITKLEEENETLKRAFDKQSGDIGNYLVELQQKDKQIDLMAEKIRKISIFLANYKGSYNKETINFTGNTEKIKQYFEKLAKEKGETI